MRIKKKHTNIQPFLEYFRVLQRYEQCGELEIRPDKHEAYIREAALYSLSPVSDDALPDTVGAKEQLLQGVPDTVRRLRTYGAWYACEGEQYLTWPFAVHVVKDSYPHAPICTIIMTQTRQWWRPWRTLDKIETITYDC